MCTGRSVLAVCSEAVPTAGVVVGVAIVVIVVYLTLANPLRSQSWSQDRLNQNKLNREQGWRQKETDTKVASKEHRRKEGTEETKIK